MRRREFLTKVVLGGTAFGAAPGLWNRLAHAATRAASPYGPLQPADGNRLRLPAGFSSRVLAITGRAVGSTSYRWHEKPDGGATFATADGGWIYTSNSEVGSQGGGVGTIRFDARGAIVGAGRILSGTSRNCAGGPTPWGTWLSCEEVSRGQVHECDPSGARRAVARPAMGRFNHEAAAVDPPGRAVYLTEDEDDGALYRFRPATWPDLSRGELEVMTERDGTLGWARVPDPSGSSKPTRDQVSGVRRFDGGEGAWYDAGRIWFTSKGDNRVWTYEPAANRLTVVYRASSPLEGVDNVTVSSSGDVFVCEDGGNMEIVMITPEGEVTLFLRLEVSESELAGVAFDPGGTRMYFSEQSSPGRTYEVSGPFRGGAGPGPTTTTTGPPPPTTTTTVPPCPT
ncbi:MAG: alkaline phosphatase PhoX [Acidimicrobiia bacterium]